MPVVTSRPVDGASGMTTGFRPEDAPAIKTGRSAPTDPEYQKASKKRYLEKGSYQTL
ncbi:hypothetical protein LV564_07970 [Komagataeibacter nataicola]|uniref:hypothetical protein n=1 Tax=Komagataeibacter nataicola TaxID=265960 RepID=UPI0014289594|nr:hypothetical protein [Komagataeibacter nataicola]WEQ56981.1 hypothetical protein LV564_07970 [Komagataeibacter nataicola]WNM08512.1 hypothetical protein RI056_17010 [Komagataeibacter nataicola]